MKIFFSFLIALSVFVLQFSTKVQAQGATPFFTISIIGIPIYIVEVIIPGDDDSYNANPFPRTPISHPIRLSTDGTYLYVYSSQAGTPVVVKILNESNECKLTHSFISSDSHELMNLSTLASGNYTLHVTLNDVTYVATLSK